MARDVVITTDAPAAVAAYSQAIKSNGLVFVSGQLGLNPTTGDFEGETVALQTAQALKNVDAILQAAGTDMAHVVKVTVYLSDIDHYGEMNEIYSTYFDAEPPARAAFAVKGLPKNGLVEIEAIAAMPD